MADPIRETTNAIRVGAKKRLRGFGGGDGWPITVLAIVQADPEPVLLVLDGYSSDGTRSWMLASEWEALGDA